MSFIPKSGQIDFTHARWAPVINCVVKYKDKILIVERNKNLNFYPGYWNGISGFLDDQSSLQEKIAEELKEELGISKDEILSIKLGQIFDQEAPEFKKTWIVHPVLVEISTDRVKLDWESINHAWVRPGELDRYQLLPGFDQVINNWY